MRKTRAAPRTARLASALALAAALAGPGGGPAAARPAAPDGPLRLPSLGEGASQTLPVATERRYGEQILQQLRRDPAWLDDAVLGDYVLSLWRPLLEAARRRGDIEADVDEAFAWDVFLLRERSLNAFALPGGRVGVHLGLIAVAGTGDELASVLAHELAHLSQRHIARGIASASRQSGAGTVAMVLGALLAARAGSAELAQAAIVGGQAALIQGQLNFTRDMEREADRVGQGIHAGAGFAAAGAVAMFDRLDRAARLNDAGALPYLRTHPLSADRLAEARSRQPAPPAPALQSTLEHALMQARARALMQPGADAARRLLEAASGGDTPEPAALYAGALAAARLGEHPRAAALGRELQASLQTVQPPPTAQADADLARARLLAGLLQAELALARGDAASAQETLASAGASRALRAPLLLRAQADTRALRQGREAGRDDAAAAAALRESVQALQTWLAGHPQDAAAWAALARAAEALGLSLRAQRAQAEERAAVGDLDAAVDLLRAAQRVARQPGREDFIEASVIDSRLRQLEAERRQRAALARGGG
jgi:predicted Zn-dependent protease